MITTDSTTYSRSYDIAQEEYDGLCDDAETVRDLPLVFAWRLPREIQGSPLIPRTGNRPRDCAIRHVVAEALAVVHVGAWVSYSRRKNWYADRNALGGPAFTYACVTGAVDFLAEAGLIDHDKALPCPGGSGLQSRFRASAQLVEAFAGVPGLRYALVRPLLLRAADGSPMPLPKTREVERIERRLARRNEALESTDIRLDIPGLDWTPDRPMLIDGRWYDPRRKQAHIIFNGDLRHGGRLYGLPYQTLNQRDHGRRSQLLIDGETVAEPDFGGCHPRLLYHQRGLEPDGEDLYAVQHPEYGRDDAKLAMQILLNASSERQGIPAFAWRKARQEAQAAEDEGGEPWTRDEIDARAREHLVPARDLMDSLRDRHDPIRDALFTGAGPRLQCIETEIMTSAAMQCLDRGVVVLPMHDSCIVQARHASLAAEAMDRAYVQHTGHRPVVGGC